MSRVSITEFEDSDWGDCVRLSNGTIELHVATEFGPRVVHCGFEGGRNEFRTYPEEREDFPLYGGHRLWHAPESHPRTYVSDDSPVEYEIESDTVRVTRSTDPGSSLRREIEVELEDADPVAIVTHRIHNEGAWPVEFAPWGLTVLEPGGEAVLPFRAQASDDSLLPDRSLQLWPYADLADDRLEFEEDYVGVHQSDDCDGALKIGTAVEEGWAAYLRDGHVFRKDFDVDPDGTYPDGGSTVEAYTREGMLELETLGTLETVGAGETAEHVETWTLAEGIEDPAAVFDLEPTPNR